VRGIARSASFFVLNALFGEPFLLKHDRAPPLFRTFSSGTGLSFAARTLELFASEVERFERAGEPRSPPPIRAA